VDRISTEVRSANMRSIRSRDTVPELLLRRMLHNAGYRFRLHRKELPGKPDLVFPGRRKVIFVHGCFWHQHPGCAEGRVPQSRRDYWEPKLTRNRERDAMAQAALKQQGWQYAVIWECELKNARAAMKVITRFLSATRNAFSRAPSPDAADPHYSRHG
jgi:DNA mismatch endonuclease, patch repair protein